MTRDQSNPGAVIVYGALAIVLTVIGVLVWWLLS